KGRIVTDGKSTFGAGAILGNGHNTLNVVDSTIKDSTANGGDGGAIQMNGTAVLNFAGSKFDTNRASDEGGAVFSAEPVKLTISKTTFVDNHSGFDGGAIRTLDPGTAVITDSRFTGNHSDTGAGGAVS